MTDVVRTMLTTVDNPYDPFTEFNEWFAFDTAQGYDTCAFIDRVAITSDMLSDEDNEQAVQDAIDEIVHENILGIYKVVTQTA